MNSRRALGMSSGMRLLRWWLNREQKAPGRGLGLVFLVQIAAYLVVACCCLMIHLHHFYYGCAILMALNFLFTVAGRVCLDSRRFPPDPRVGKPGRLKREVLDHRSCHAQASRQKNSPARSRDRRWPGRLASQVLLESLPVQEPGSCTLSARPVP